MYLMISKYLKPLDEVNRVRDDHYAFLDGLEEQGLVLLAGRQDPPVGGVILIDVDSKERAIEIFAGDPYVTAGVAEYTATGWNPGRGSLKEYLEG
jgi:uncharacterized protein YciI